MDTEKILSNLVRVGTVTAVDNSARKARALFKDTGLTSGWLQVLQYRPIPEHPDPCLAHWMPWVNDQVLVIYLPMLNADGFILGGI